MVLGSSFLLLCDTIGRVALGGEIPLGVMTSLFGAAIFIIILTRKQSEVSCELRL
jgi:iron complex transport system permease protein